MTDQGKRRTSEIQLGQGDREENIRQRDAGAEGKCWGQMGCGTEGEGRSKDGARES